MAGKAEFHPNVLELDLGDISFNHALLIVLIIFCALFLIIMYFFLYFLPHLRHNISSATAAPPNAPGNRTADRAAAPRLGLDSETINSIPSVTYESMSGSKELECSICLGAFEEDEMVKVMPECIHAYHSECIDKWLRRKSSCPLCRSSMDTNADSIPSSQPS